MVGSSSSSADFLSESLRCQFHLPLLALVANLEFAQFEPYAPAVLCTEWKVGQRLPINLIVSIRLTFSKRAGVGNVFF
jgi:hypothetical protein